MLFNSWPFLVLFLVTFVLFYLKPLRRWQTEVLIVASLVFYAWENPWLLMLLCSSILVNAALSYALLVRGPKRFFAVSMAAIVFNLAVLAFFKYGGFVYSFFGAGDHGSKIYHFLVSIPLPIGISFYTFEGISLIVDLIRSEKPEQIIPSAHFPRHLANTTLFICFFPHLVSGPILKARHFYPQIKTKFFADIPWERVFRDLVTGFFLKLVIADNLKDYTFYMDPKTFPSQPGLHLLVLIFGYSFQIFSDFAGYSLMAIGLARSLGYELPDNFNFPYIAASLKEFWQRWHISLSQWLRDYLYIPLGGNRKGVARAYFNLFIVMALGGLWHGAASSFLVWGAYHGLGLVVERGFGDLGVSLGSSKWTAPFRIILVFAFVTLGWLLFKLTSITEALGYLKAVGANWSKQSNPSFVFSVLLFCSPAALYHLWYLGADKVPARLRSHLAPCAYGFMLFLILMNSGTTGRFIYFQF